MRTPEDIARAYLADTWGCDVDHPKASTSDLETLLTEWEAEVRADERGRCARIHNTLTDDDLVAELVRRGVLKEETATLTHPHVAAQAGSVRYVTAWQPIDTQEGQ